jgi:probable HAF family extracellular repeat protein
MSFRISTVIAILSTACAMPWAAGQTFYTSSTITFAGAANTNPLGINNIGQIVGGESPNANGSGQYGFLTTGGVSPAAAQADSSLVNWTTHILATGCHNSLDFGSWYNHNCVVR